MTQTHMNLHVTALLNPETPEEQTLANLTAELGVLADRYKGDTVMLPAVTNLAQCIIKLAGDGNPGRIDPTTLIRKVENIVEQVGAKADD